MHCARRATPALCSSASASTSSNRSAPPGCPAARRPSLAQPRRRVAAAAAVGGASFPNGTGPDTSTVTSTVTSSSSPGSTAPQLHSSPSTSGAAQQSGVSPAPAPSPTAAPPPPTAPTAAAAAPSPPAEEQEPVTLLARVKRFFTGSKLDRARLAALGFGAFSAYGVISNINAGILITISWLTVVRSTGLTPLDGGNWPRFLAIYAGLWIGSNFLRPVRLTLALAAAPLFDAAIGFVSKRTGLPKVPAFVVMLLGIAVGTTSCLAATIAVLGGFPPGCRLPWQPA